MDDMVLMWLIIGIVLVLAEIVTFNFITIWFAFGAFIAMFTALFTENTLVQFAVFIIASTVLLLATKPLVKRYLLKRKVPTNADRLIGEIGVVMGTIDNIRGTGVVKISGMEWRARSADDSEIGEGELVTVTKIEGVTLSVARKE